VFHYSSPGCFNCFGDQTLIATYLNLGLFSQNAIGNLFPFFAVVQRRAGLIYELSGRTSVKF
tara:strand:- start:39 stop:224 length:186 start_codon:yes stop_codon:yes gene_type:complete